MKGLLILLAFAIIFFIATFVWLRKQSENIEYETVIDDDSTNPQLKMIAEYRTHIVNEWVGSLVYWINIPEDSINVKVLSPEPNKNTLFLYYEGMEIVTFFDWDARLMSVSASLYCDKEGYKVLDRVFILTEKGLPIKHLYNFIQKVINESDDFYKLTPEDMLNLVHTLKIKDNPADKNIYYEGMCDLMMLMRRRKFRRDRKMVNTYVLLMDYFWKTEREEFLKYLTEEEKEEGNE